MAGETPTGVFEDAKVHFVEGHATVYDRVEVLSSGWLRCGDEPHGPLLFPPHMVDHIDAGYQG